MKGRLAALTMAHNEPFFAPIWCRHYARQVGGSEHCYLLDHGTTDGSTTGLPVNVLPRPRTVRDEEARVGTVTEAVAELLERYDAVVHSDIDELLVADPRRFPTLADYAAAAPGVTTAFGLELQHLPGDEPALDPGRPLGQQRRWVRFAAAMCKPALVKHPVQWSPGFHSSGAPLVLDALYLVHLRYVDLGAALRRLAGTRAMAIANPAAHAHQRVSDEDFAAMVRAIAALPQEDADPFDLHAPPLSVWAGRLSRSRAEREDQRYKLDLSLSGDRLWALPPAFRAALQ